jgi:hypothetical protein
MGALPAQQAPPRRGTPPVPSYADESSEIEGVPPVYVYIHALFHSD